MTKKDANQMVKDAQDKFIKDSMETAIAIIDARIKQEAEGSKMYKSLRASMPLSGKLMIVQGALEIPLKDYYNDNGFDFEIVQESYDDYPILTIGW